MSIAGGFDKTLERGEKINCRAIQIFTKSNNQWKAKEITDKELHRFHSLYNESRISPVVAHDSYLINLASPDPDLHRKSMESFLDEMERCEKLRIPYLVFHPGAHIGSGEKAGLKKIAKSTEVRA